MADNRHFMHGLPLVQAVQEAYTQKQRITMKKGQRVRILRNNEIGTIADSEFFKLNGQKHIRYRVVTRINRQGCWYPAEQLGDVMERATVTIRNEDGQELTLSVSRNYLKESLEMKLTGQPHNLKEHDEGLHIMLMTNLLNGIYAETKETRL